MPMAAFAAATRRSAAATSGRRSSKVEGTPTGTLGSGSAAVDGGSAKPAGGTPISSAMACSIWARATPRSIDCAFTLRTCVSAWATSTAVAMPPLNRTWVSCK